MHTTIGEADVRRTGSSIWMLAAALGAASAADAAGQEARPQFTTAQVEAGKAVFGRICAACHSADLSGSETAPPLMGEGFANNWGRSRFDELFEFVSTEMPKSAPGTLDRDTYLRALAYVLSVNGLPAGGTELAPDDHGVIGLAVK